MFVTVDLAGVSLVSDEGRGGSGLVGFGGKGVNILK